MVFIWIWNHHQIVLLNVIAPLVEHETAFTRQTEQMHAGVAQLAGVHPVEVGGIVKRMICAKSENRDVFCETQVPDNHRTFAASNLKNDNHLWKQ
jgi:hypothetical protein